MNGFVVVNPPENDPGRVIAGMLGMKTITLGQRAFILERLADIKKDVTDSAEFWGISKQDVIGSALANLREMLPPRWRYNVKVALGRSIEGEIDAPLLEEDAYFEYIEDSDLLTEIFEPADAPEPEPDPAYPPQEVIDGWLRACRCCPDCSDPPCGSVQQGSVCEERCRCDEGSDDDYDPNACPGCGGNCQTACR